MKFLQEILVLCPSNCWQVDFSLAPFDTLNLGVADTDLDKDIEVHFECIVNLLNQVLPFFEEIMKIWLLKGVGGSFIPFCKEYMKEEVGDFVRACN